MIFYFYLLVQNLVEHSPVMYVVMRKEDIFNNNIPILDKDFCSVVLFEGIKIILELSSNYDHLVLFLILLPLYII